MCDNRYSLLMYILNLVHNNYIYIYVHIAIFPFPIHVHIQNRSGSLLSDCKLHYMMYTKICNHLFTNQIHVSIYMQEFIIVIAIF